MDNFKDTIVAWMSWSGIGIEHFKIRSSNDVQAFFRAEGVELGFSKDIMMGGNLMFLQKNLKGA